MKKLITSVLLALFVGNWAMGQVPELVKDINGTSSSSFIPAGNKIFGNYNGKLYFRAALDFTTQGDELWVSDGTAAGTELFKEIMPGANGSSPEQFHEVNGQLLFFASSASGTELWRTDGTVGGTNMVKDIYPGSQSSIPALNNPFFESYVWNNVLYFPARDGNNGHELWRSDGTADGTYLLKDINLVSTPTGSAIPAYFTGNLYFSALEAMALGRELWVTDGTTDGTQLVADLSPGVLGSNPTDMVVCNGLLIFIAQGGSGTELYRSDGTAAGTMLLKDINPGFMSGLSTSFNFESERSLVKFENRVYFRADDGAGSSGLWSTDGTSGGTFLVGPSTTSIQPDLLSNLIVHGDRLYYRFNDGNKGHELWSTDGTSVGTAMVKDIFLGSSNSTPNFPYIISFNGYLFFNAEDANNGLELWRSDGTSTGTVMVADIAPGNGDANPEQFSTVGDDLFFIASTPDIGGELWKLSVPPFVPLNANIQQIDEIKCFGDATASLQIYVSGGTEPYSYTWNNPGIQGPNPMNMVAGNYTVTVTDGNNVIIALSITVTQPMVLAATTTSNPATHANANGSATVTVTGGTSPYTYLWNTTPPATTASASNIVAGTYTVVVTDVNGCTVSATATVDMNTGGLDEVFANAISIAPSPASNLFSINCAQCTGTMEVVLMDMQGRVLQTWSKVPFGQLLNIEQAIAGTYWVKVTKDGHSAVKPLIISR
jgi:ELWxxDGT repeat protein